jgi:hypothetical protein
MGHLALQATTIRPEVEVLEERVCLSGGKEMAFATLPCSPAGIHSPPCQPQEPHGPGGEGRHAGQPHLPIHPGQPPPGPPVVPRTGGFAALSPAPAPGPAAGNPGQPTPGPAPSVNVFLGAVVLGPTPSGSADADDVAASLAGLADLDSEETPPDVAANITATPSEPVLPPDQTAAYPPANTVALVLTNTVLAVGANFLPKTPSGGDSAFFDSLPRRDNAGPWHGSVQENEEAQPAERSSPYLSDLLTHLFATDSLWTDGRIQNFLETIDHDWFPLVSSDHLTWMARLLGLSSVLMSCSALYWLLPPKRESERARCPERIDWPTSEPMPWEGP